MEVDVVPLPQWSSWIDRDNPGGVGDYEMSKSCAQPIDIECQEVDGTSTFKDPNSPSGYHCNTTEGGWCKNGDPPGTQCRDIEVRYLCQGKMKP